MLVRLCGEEGHKLAGKGSPLEASANGVAMLNFADCVHPREEAALEPPVVSQESANREVEGHPAPADSELEQTASASALARGHGFPLSLLPRRQQPRAEQTKAGAASATVEPSEQQSVEVATEGGAQGTAGEGPLRGTLHAIAQAGGYAGALVLEALQGVGSLHMGPMGTLPVAVSTPVSDVRLPHDSTHVASSAPERSHNNCVAMPPAREQSTYEDRAVPLGSEGFNGVPGRGKGKQRAPLVPLSTVMEEAPAMDEVPEEISGSPKRKSLEILRSLFTHKIQAIAAAVA